MPNLRINLATDFLIPVEYFKNFPQVNENLWYIKIEQKNFYLAV